MPWAETVPQQSSTSFQRTTSIEGEARLPEWRRERCAAWAELGRVLFSSINSSLTTPHSPLLTLPSPPSKTRLVTAPVSGTAAELADDGQKSAACRQPSSNKKPIGIGALFRETVDLADGARVVSPRYNRPAQEHRLVTVPGSIKTRLVSALANRSVPIWQTALLHTTHLVSYRTRLATRAVGAELHRVRAQTGRRHPVRCASILTWCSMVMRG
jgi:hypothetical protein